MCDFIDDAMPDEVMIALHMTTPSKCDNKVNRIEQIKTCRISTIIEQINLNSSLPDIH